MKKIKKVIGMMTILAFAFPLVSVAKTDPETILKEPKAVEIKIHKKQILSEDERRSIDESKGNAANKGQTGKTPSSWAEGVLGESLPEGGTKYAIVVGLANYSGVTNDLCVVKTDVSDPTIFGTDDARYYCQDYDSVHMRQMLIEEYGYAPENVLILRDAEATKAGITAAMDDIKGRLTNGDDEVTFFFSGHGTSGKLISLKDRETIDEAAFTYDNNFLWDDELKIWADSLSAYRMVFAFDICLAGGMNDLAGENRIIVMSSAETQSSWTYTLGGSKATDGSFSFSEGLFSHYFVVDGMANGLADGSNSALYKDNQVAVEESFSYAYPIVKLKQAPVLNDRFLNDLVL